jgi:hypothetical protein
MSPRTLRANPAEERGVALVEFALVLPLVLLLLFGMIDFGKAINYWNDETHLANEAARYAAVNSNPGGSGSLEDWIKQRADSGELKYGGASIESPGVSVSFCFVNRSGGAPVTTKGAPIRATVSATYHWLGYLVGKGLPTKQTIAATSTMRLEKDYPTDPTQRAYLQGGAVAC